MHHRLPLALFLTPLLACEAPTPDVEATSRRALEAFARTHQPADEGIARIRERLGAGVLVRLRRGRPRSLYGHALGGVRLADPTDVDAAVAAIRGFFEANADLYGLTPGQAEGLELVEVQDGGHLGLQLAQRHQGLRVLEGRFYVAFARDGRLTQIVGGPVPQSKLPKTVAPRLDADAARRRAGALAKDATAGAPELVVSETRGLGYRAHLDGPTRESTTWVDARLGEAEIVGDDIDHLLRAIPVTHYRHANGSRTETVTRTRDINVDISQLPFGAGGYCWFRLQRLGSGRARMWQGFGEGATPSFDQTTIFRPCLDDDPFTVLPGGGGNRRFNEQQTYYWAQVFKTYVDNWGRRPNGYGHYPVDAGREVNVEIVTNGSSTRENSWCNTGVQHGCFRSRAQKSWFVGHPASGTEVPAVFFFNVGNNSYHFNGTDNAASYAIVAHEVGHFVSWSYGGWAGPLRSSLSEGFSMVFSGLMGRDNWSAVGYADDDDVRTGGPMWNRHTGSGDLAVYAGMSCGDNAYELAEPFVQFMWRLMNNQDASGNPIWSSNSAAIANTADRTMDALHDLAGVSSLEWDDVASHILVRTFDAIYTDGTEQGALGASGWFSDSINRMSTLIQVHGLNGTCQ